MLTNARSTDPSESAAAYDLRCCNCSWKRLHIVTNEYAQTLRLQHEFRYDKHTVEVAS
jgi:hypothetical protein